MKSQYIFLQQVYAIENLTTDANTIKIFEEKPLFCF